MEYLENIQANSTELKKKEKYYNPETKITEHGFLLKWSHSITKDNVTSDTLEGAYAYVDVLKNYLGFDDRISDETKWMLNILYKNKKHKEARHNRVYEAVVLGCIVIAHERCRLKFDFDLVEFIDFEWKSYIDKQSKIINDTNWIYGYLKGIFEPKIDIDKLDPIVKRY